MCNTTPQQKLGMQDLSRLSGFHLGYSGSRGFHQIQFLLQCFDHYLAVIEADDCGCVGDILSVWDKVLQSDCCHIRLYHGE